MGRMGSSEAFSVRAFAIIMLLVPVFELAK
jgi:hypothetical protein